MSRKNSRSQLEKLFIQNEDGNLICWFRNFTDSLPLLIRRLLYHPGPQHLCEQEESKTFCIPRYFHFQDGFLGKTSRLPKKRSNRIDLFYMLRKFVVISENLTWYSSVCLLIFEFVNHKIVICWLRWCHDDWLNEAI